MIEPYCSSAVLGSSEGFVPSAQPVAANSELRAEIWTLLARLSPPHTLPERRRGARVPFPYLILLTPLEDDGCTPVGHPIVVVGRHISELGLDFYHPQPLPHRRMIASLERPDGTWLSLVVDINRCRFTREGWYESGCRFLQVIDWPIEKLR